MTSAEFDSIFAEVTPYGIAVTLRREIKKSNDMQGSFVMLQMDDLRRVVTEIVEEVCARRGLNEKPSCDEGEWLTREEVCEMLPSLTRLYGEKRTRVSSGNTRWADVTYMPRKMWMPCLHLL